MSSWSKIDDFRDRVLKAPVPEIGPGPHASLQEPQEALDRSGFTPERLLVLGWELFLSRRRQEGLERWHFSARLHPPGRPSTKEDWEVLGKIAARVGAPRDPVLLPEDPNATVHWAWNRFSS